MNTAAPDILNLANYPDLHAPAAEWFSSQWHVPTDAYRASMADGLHAAGGVPAWYIVRDGAEIGAGIGIIANDFHKRPDLTPNLCALYVAPPYRGRGWARALLNCACADLAAHGVPDAYLITGHTALYERMGWTFYGMVTEDGGGQIRMYHKSL